MRVVLVGSPAERERLRAQLDDRTFEIVGEFPSLTAAEAAATPAGAVDAIIVGRHGFSERARSDRFDEPTEALTAREIQVLELLAEGLSNKAIAGRLAISDQTVKFHVASISGKLGATNRTDAVRRAVRRGLITL
jgi:DNA-binding CsgD family transcriptional regulator